MLTLVLPFSVKSQDQSFFYNNFLELKKTDSIEKIVLPKTSDPKEKLRVLLSLEKSYYLSKNTKKGTNLLSINEIYSKYNLKEGRGVYYYLLAEFFKDKAKGYESLINYNQALTYFKAEKDSFGIANTLISLSISPPFLNDTSQVKTIIANLQTAENLINSLHNTKLHIRLFQAKFFINDHFRSKIFPEKNLTLDSLESKVKNTNDYEWGFSFVKSNKGNFAFEKENYEEAIYYWNKALETYIKLDNSKLCLDTYYNLSSVCTRLKKYKEAKSMAKKSLELAQQNGFIYDEYKAYHMLCYISELEKDMNSAYNYSLLMLEKKDSISLLERNKDIIEFNITNKTKELEIQNELLTEKQMNLKLRQTYLYIILSIIGVSLIIFYRLYKLSQVLNKKLNEQNIHLASLTKTKDYFMSIVAHDIKRPINSLFGVSKTINYLLESKQFDKIKRISNAIDKASINTSKFIDNLFQWSLTQTNAVQTNQEYIPIHLFIQQFFSTYITIDSNIVMINNCDQELKILFDKIHLETILRNLLDNSIKNINPNKDLKVTIRTQLIDNSLPVQLIYEDTASGIADDVIDDIIVIFNNPDAFYPKTRKIGIGSILISKLAFLNQSTIKVVHSTPNGSMFVMTLSNFIS